MGHVHDNLKFWVSIYVLVFFCLMIPLQFWGPTATNFTYTYELGAVPGQLTSDRATLDFIIMASHAFMWAIPLTAMAMALYMRKRWVAIMHITVTAILLLWYVLAFSYNLVNLLQHNPDPTIPAQADWRLNNPFTSKRWCGAYNGISGAVCYTTAVWIPAVLKESLRPDGTAVFVFVFQFIQVALLTFDFFFTMCKFVPDARRGFMRQ